MKYLSVLHCGLTSYFLVINSLFELLRMTCCYVRISKLKIFSKLFSIFRFGDSKRFLSPFVPFRLNQEASTFLCQFAQRTSLSQGNISLSEVKTQELHLKNVINAKGCLVDFETVNRRIAGCSRLARKGVELYKALRRV